MAVNLNSSSVASYIIFSTLSFVIEKFCEAGTFNTRPGSVPPTASDLPNCPLVTAKSETKVRVLIFVILFATVVNKSIPATSVNEPVSESKTVEF